MSQASETGAPDYEGGGLSRETNWWGAFVIGLAGTILVTGIAPVMITSLGAAAIPRDHPDHDHRLPALPVPCGALGDDAGAHRRVAHLLMVGYKDRWPRFAKHVNGFTCLGVLAGLVPGGGR